MGSRPLLFVILLTVAFAAEDFTCGTDQIQNSLAKGIIQLNCKDKVGVINGCCAAHDKCYDNQEGRPRCDETFCGCVKAAAKGNPFCGISASSFCDATRLLGQGAYDNAGKKKAIKRAVIATPAPGTPAPYTPQKVEPRLSPKEQRELEYRAAREKLDAEYESASEHFRVALKNSVAISTTPHPVISMAFPFKSAADLRRGTLPKVASGGGGGASQAPPTNDTATTTTTTNTNTNATGKPRKAVLVTAQLEEIAKKLSEIINLPPNLDQFYSAPPDVASFGTVPKTEEQLIAEKAILLRAKYEAIKKARDAWIAEGKNQPLKRGGLDDDGRDAEVEVTIEKVQWEPPTKLSDESTEYLEKVLEEARQRKAEREKAEEERKRKECNCDPKKKKIDNSSEAAPNDSTEDDSDSSKSKKLGSKRGFKKDRQAAGKAQVIPETNNSGEERSHETNDELSLKKKSHHRDGHRKHGGYKQKKPKNTTQKPQDDDSEENYSDKPRGSKAKKHQADDQSEEAANNESQEQPAHKARKHSNKGSESSGSDEEFLSLKLRKKARRFSGRANGVKTYTEEEPERRAGGVATYTGDLSDEKAGGTDEKKREQASRKKEPVTRKLRVLDMSKYAGVTSRKQIEKSRELRTTSRESSREAGIKTESDEIREAYEKKKAIFERQKKPARLVRKTDDASNDEEKVNDKRQNDSFESDDNESSIERWKKWRAEKRRQELEELQSPHESSIETTD